jgi:hypothetical protein
MHQGPLPASDWQFKEDLSASGCWQITASSPSAAGFRSLLAFTPGMMFLLLIPIFPTTVHGSNSIIVALRSSNNGCVIVLGYSPISPCTTGRLSLGSKMGTSNIMAARRSSLLMSLISRPFPKQSDTRNRLGSGSPNTWNGTLNQVSSPLISVRVRLKASQMDHSSSKKARRHLLLLALMVIAASTV